MQMITNKIIKEKTMEKIKSLYFRGDVRKLSEITGMHQNSISNFFKTGKINPEALEKILQFYDDRENILNQFE